MRPICAIIVLICLLADPPPSLAEGLDGVIRRTLAAYGGEALPEQGSVIETVGRAFSQRRGVEGRIRRRVAWPDRLSVEIAFPGGEEESRHLDGARGWRDGAPAPVPLVLAMRLQAARLSLPMLLGWERESVRDLGPARRRDGTEVRRLEVDLGDGLALYVEIAAETGRILRSAGVMRLGGAEMSFGAAYADFAPIGRLTWPLLEHQSAMGRPIGWTRIETLRHGDSPAAGQFRP